MVDSLVCNFKDCFKELTTDAIITFCSHIFCVDHGRKIKIPGKCLACNKELLQHQLLEKNLNLSSNGSLFLLAGESPSTIMKVATSALNFWLYQKKHEREISKRIVDHSQSKLQKQAQQIEEKEIRIESMQQEVEKLKNEKQALKAELALKSESIHRLKRAKKDQDLFGF